MSRETRIKDVKKVLSDEVKNPENYFVRFSTEGCIPKNRDAIYMYADEACVEACQRLYDLNIETVNSGANLVGVTHVNDNAKAFIGINYNSLDEKNKIIADNMIKNGIASPPPADNGGRYHGQSIITISVPINRESLVGEISDKLLELANMFEQQDVLYGRMTYEEIVNTYLEKQEDGLYKDHLSETIIKEEEIPELINDYMKYGIDNFPRFTEDGVTYFVTEDLLNKHQAYVKSLEVSKKD